MSPAAQARRGFGDASGFSLLQMLITVAILTILVSVSVFGISSARAGVRLQNSARAFAQNAERARLDAIRRHATTRVEFTGPNTYEVEMDFNGSGLVQTRSFTLDTNVALTTDGAGSALPPNPCTSSTAGCTILYPSAFFDQRGRTTDCSMLFNMANERGDATIVQVTGSGDITVNRSAVTSLTPITYTNVNSSSGISTSAVVNGSNPPLNVTACGSGGTGVTGSSSSVAGTTVTCASGSITPSTGYVSIRRNGGSTQTVNITVNAPGTITASPDPNLGVTPATRSVTSSSGGTYSFTISSVNKMRGTYAVNFYFAACSPAVVYVKVTN